MPSRKDLMQGNGGKINPLDRSISKVSAVPMAARVSQKVAP